MRRLFLPAVMGLLLVSAPLAAQEEELMPSHEAWEEHVAAVLIINEGLAGESPSPLAQPMLVCHDTDCDALTYVSLSAQEQGRIVALFAVPPTSPAEERQLVGRAVALIETFVGPQNGTANDHARNAHQDGEPGQLDCISEATNTTTYLTRLAESGFLRHHRVGGFVQRFLLFLQHVAMEVIETASGDSYVVDAWEGANGEEPVITPYLDWRLKFEV